MLHLLTITKRLIARMLNPNMTYFNITSLIRNWLALKPRNHKLFHIRSVDFFFAVFLVSDIFQRYNTNILSGKILLWKV